MSLVVTLLCLSNLCVGQIPRIALGDAVTATLPLNDRGQAGLGVHLFIPDKDGTITLLAEALDFDVQLAIRTSTLEFLARDHNGGIGWNSRIVHQVKGGFPYYLVTARTKPGLPAEYSVRLHEGDVPLPTGLERNRLEAAHYLAFAERALERGAREGAAISWCQGGVMQYRLAEFLESRHSYERALGIAREIENERLVDYLVTNLGLVCMRLGDHSDAVRYLTEHIEMARKKGDLPAEAKDHAILGDVYIALSRHEEARAALEKAKTLFTKVGDRLNAARVEGSLGELCLARSQLDDAAQHFQSQLDTFIDIGHEHMQAYAYERFARVSQQTLDFDSVIDLSNRAIAIYQKVGDRAGEARGLAYLARGLGGLGRSSEAVEAIQRAIGLTEETGDVPSRTKQLLSLASIHLTTRDLDQADDAVRESMTLAQGKGLRATEAQGLRLLSSSARFRRDYRESARLASQAVALHTELGMKLEVIPSLSALGDTQRLLGETDQARVTYEDAVARAHAAKHVQYEVHALCQLAFLESELGHSTRSAELYHAALEAMDDAGSQDSVSRNSITRYLAQLQLDAGEIAPALSAAEALLEHRALLPTDRLAALWILARGRFMRGDIARAKAAFDRADPSFDALGVFHQGDGGNSWRSVLAKWESLGHDLTLALHDAAKSDVEKRRIVDRGFRRAGVWKGRSLLAGMIEHATGFRSRESIPITRDIRALQRREGALQEQLAGRMRELDDEKAKALRAELAVLVDKRQGLVAKLEQVSPQDAEIEVPRGIDTRTVAEAIGDAMFVEFAVGNDTLAAYVVTANQSTLVSLGSRLEVETELARYLKSISDPNHLGSFADIGTTGKSLYDRLITPIETAVGGLAQRWLIVPSGQFSRFPLEALVVERPAAAASFADLSFVVDRYDVSYAPSAAVWAHLESQRPIPRKRRALVLADPLYEAPLPAVAMRDGRKLVRLEKTRTEALSVAPLFLTGSAANGVSGLEKHRSASLRTDGLDLFLGADAGPGVLERDLRDYTVLHFAVHGFVDGRFPQDSALELSGRGDGGRFTLTDVMELDLKQPLVVLSACNTASGKWRYGEGVESLARAFLYAGARDVVASLWQVSDQAAASTMVSFYRTLIEGDVTPAIALTLARRSLRRTDGDFSLRGVVGLVADPRKAKPARVEVGHPFFWAPFIAIGGK